MMDLQTALNAVLVLAICCSYGQAQSNQQPDTELRKESCGGLLRGMNGTIESPNYPGEYPADVSCEWSIPVIVGFYIHLDSVVFDLDEKYEDTCIDYLEIEKEKFCGSMNISKTYKDGVSMTFYSDENRQSTGFSINYQQVPIPKCDPPCLHGGTCVAVNKCSCPENYGGFRCYYSIIVDADKIKPSTASVSYGEGLFKSCAFVGNNNVRGPNGNAITITDVCDYVLAEFLDVKIIISLYGSEHRGTSGLKKIQISKGEVDKIQILFRDQENENQMTVRDVNGRLHTQSEFAGQFNVVELLDKIRITAESIEVIADRTGEKLSIVFPENVVVNGLCSKFDGNEYLTPTGAATANQELFVKSWSQEETCMGSYEAETHENLFREVCNNFYTSPFARCLEYLNPVVYHNMCMQDMALCGGLTLNKECNCPATAQFAQDCMQIHPNTRPVVWRTHYCKKECPENQQYSDCTSMCQKSCRNVDAVDDCDGQCIDGCVCEDGLYLDGERCVKKEDCSCYFGKEKLVNGQVYYRPCEECKCEGGKVKCERVMCNGFGLVYGNPMYYTFDGESYSYYGTCEYTLLKLEDGLEVMVDMEECGDESAFTCINHVSITSDTYPKVKLLKTGKVEVDGQLLELPYLSYNTLEIQQINNITVVVKVFKSFAEIQFSEDGVVMVTVDKSWHSKTKGMLGNFNSRTDDEYKSRSNIVESNIDEFGVSWRTDEACQEPLTSGEDKCIALPEDKKRCVDALNSAKAFDMCLSTTSFGEIFKKSCQASMCAFSEKGEAKKVSSVCTMMSVLGRMCAMSGYVVDWRSGNFCAMTCGEGKEYKPWSSPCGKTCRALSDEDSCTITQKAEGCFCPAGKFENKNGVCVEKETCECFYDEEWRDNGHFFMSKGKACECKGGVVKCTETGKPCPTNMISSKCNGGTCQPTCTNRKPNCAKVCEPGCACPNGTLYHKEKCITEDKCPCSFQGEEYENGKSVIDDCDDCKCEKGLWNCIRTTMCSRTCSVTSGSYIKTFDNSRFHSRGTCEYQLMTDQCPDSTSDLNFVDIRIRSHSCLASEHTMCNITLDMTIGNIRYILSRDQPLQQFGVKNKLQYASIVPTIMKVGFYEVLEFSFPNYFIQISYDGKTSVNIEVSKNITDPEFGLKLCGLCGNLDDNAGNDFNNLNYAEFINSQKIGQCADVSISDKDACQDNSKGEENAKIQCQILKSDLFAKCHEKIEVKPFFDTCVTETCSCDTGGQCECYCTAVAAYASACGRAGAKVNWRPVSGCPVECEEFTDPDGDLCEIKYDVCNTCVKTCCAKCTRGCFEGCFPKCTEDQVYDPENKKCVNEADCGTCIYGPTVIITGTTSYTTGSTTSYTVSVPTTFSYTTTAYSTATTPYTSATGVSTATTPYISTTGVTTATTPYSTTGVTTATTPYSTTGVTTTTTPYIPTTGVTTGTTGSTTGYTTATTTACPTNCVYAFENGSQHDLPMNSSMTLNCKTYTCEMADSGCAVVVKNPKKCDPVSCSENYREETVNCCDTCICDKCSIDGKTYKPSEVWEDGCLEKICNFTTCSVNIFSNKSDYCSTQRPNCGIYTPLFINYTTGTCCPEYDCRCNKSLCPPKKSCVGGSKVNPDLGENCCDVEECLPTCKYNNEEYKNNSIIENTVCSTKHCLCNDETCEVVEKKNKVCPPNPICTNDDITHYPTLTSSDGCCKENQCKCECKVYGDPRFVSFDGRHYSYQGLCHYTLVKYRDSTDLEIITDHQDCVPQVEHVSCVKSLIVLWKGTKVVLSIGNTVHVNDEEILSLPITRGGIRIKNIPNNYIQLVIAEIRLKIEFKGRKDDGYIFIEVPMTSWNNTSVGLCGTCTNTRDDDFEKKDGNRTDVVDDFAGSWEYNTTDEDCMPCKSSDKKECWNCTNPNHGDNVPEYCKAPCNKTTCEVLKNHEVFSNCQTDVDDYYDSCVEDMELTRKCDVCKSPSLEVYAKSCSSCVKWREALNCTSECPNGKVFKECEPECSFITSCSNIDIPDTDKQCDSSKISSGCSCPEGQVLKDSNSKECVDVKCCACEDTQCPNYMNVVLKEGEDPNDCCAKKKCECKKVENPPCESPQILIEIDEDTPGCKRNVCRCPTDYTCPDVYNNCQDIDGCRGEEITDICGCPKQYACSCDASTCEIPSTTCPRCETASYHLPEIDTEKACNGSCCNELACTPVECDPVEVNIPGYPTPECPFIKRIGTGYEVSDLQECCPTSYDIQCISEKCSVIETKTNCTYGYKLVTKLVKDSLSKNVSKYGECPRVDDCCPHAVCECDSCRLPNGDRLLIGDRILFDDGCGEYSCNRGTNLTNGCFEAKKELPKCPPKIECPCNQKLKTIPPKKGAKDTDEWDDLCCPGYECIDIECGDDYDAGPTNCSAQEEMETAYKEVYNGTTDKNCVYTNCPIRRCVCTKCEDPSGAIYEKGEVVYEKCGNRTCISDDERECPYFKLDTVSCISRECSSEYEVRHSRDIPGECCPEVTCSCKPYDELQNCKNWQIDASSCPDDEHMIIENDPGKYQDHKCCPEKRCLCKNDTILKDECAKWTDYECEYELQKRITIKNITDNNCCPDYKCECDCSTTICDYPSYEPDSTKETCDCECKCNTDKCSVDVVEEQCGAHEKYMENGTKENGCCPKFECVCIKEDCPTLPSANCNRYQIEYPWYSDLRDCCPIENRCRCKDDVNELSELCNSTTLENCPKGHEPYVANIHPSQLTGVCCDIQCACVNCITADGAVKEPGAVWYSNEECYRQVHRCSNERLSSGCHKIITENEHYPCVTLTEYESNNCSNNEYAVEVVPTTGCCTEYTCKSCSIWECEGMFEVQSSNTTHDRCPGACKCVDPLNENQKKTCLDIAKCPLYHEARESANQDQGKLHNETCCPNYDCICSPCPDDYIAKSDVSFNATLCETVGKKENNENECCPEYEIQCNNTCNCPTVDLNCQETEGCSEKEKYSICGCSIPTTCECKPEMCSKLECSKCFRVQNITTEIDINAACNGNCCQPQKCQRLPCEDLPSRDIPEYCDFVTENATFSSSDLCCPDQNEFVCNKEKCPAEITNPDGCDEGYELVSVLISESDNETIRRYKDCPMVDKCCPHKICRCKSCVYEGNKRLELGAKPVYSANGCTKYSCNKDKRLEDGCYEISELKPLCHPPPSCKCYQTLETYDPKYGATNESQWEELCCPSFDCVNNECGENYTSTNIKCEAPAVIETTYKTDPKDESCSNLNCPIVKCVCTKCQDKWNNLHDVGAVYQEDDICENITCVTVEGQLCPQPRVDRHPCDKAICNETYQNLISLKINDSCCPEESCSCKPDDALKNICKDWKDNTSHCPDQKHMKLVQQGTAEHQCCPNFMCQCKTGMERDCLQYENYYCGANYTRVQTKEVSEINCCPEFDCTCDCSDVECEYDTWSAKTGDNECNCQCSCDPSKCKPEPPCGEVKVPVIVNRTDGDCCPVYECMCNKTCEKPEEEPECNIYQSEAILYNDDDECCPQKYCHCSSDETLEKICEESFNKTCRDGYRKIYTDPVSKCCSTCECEVCFTEDGKVLRKPGESWNITDNNNCRVTQTCSNERDQFGCHIVKNISSEISECKRQEDAIVCRPFEVVRKTQNPYKCCPEINCECSVDENVLKDTCKNYSGISCSKHRESKRLAYIPDCCPEHECVCKLCDYKCPSGQVAIKGVMKTNESDLCCFEYECVCSTCESMNGTSLTVGESLITEKRQGCNIKEVCQRINDVCKIDIDDPSEKCQTKEEYQELTCNMPYQYAVATGSFMDNNECCESYKCECNETSSHCPPVSATNCKPSQRAEVNGVVKNTSDCCDAYRCVCRDDAELLSPSICEKPKNYTCKDEGYVPKRVDSDDPCCHNFTCECDPTQCKQYNFTCEPGNSKFDTGRGSQCCPEYECRCTDCVIDQYVKKVNEVWSDNCRNLTCTASDIAGLCPTVKSTPKYDCDIVDADDCENRGGVLRGIEKYEGCCKECTLCKRVELKVNLTQTIGSKICTSSEAIDIGRCDGACPGDDIIDPKTGKFNDNATCACCFPTTETQSILFFCGEEKSEVLNISSIKSCACTGED